MHLLLDDTERRHLTQLLRCRGIFRTEHSFYAAHAPLRCAALRSSSTRKFWCVMATSWRLARKGHSKLLQMLRCGMSPARPFCRDSLIFTITSPTFVVMY